MSLRTFSIKNLIKDAKVIYVSNVGNQTKDTKWGLVEIVGITDFTAYTALQLILGCGSNEENNVY